MRGISKKPVKYVCECDKGLPEKEQTVFWLKPKTYKEVNSAMGRYSGAVKEDQEGQKHYNINRLNSADQEEWCEVVTKIENFAFDLEALKADAKLAEIADEKGYIKVIEDDRLKIKVLEHLPAGIYNEIFKAAQDLNALKVQEKNA